MYWSLKSVENVQHRFVEARITFTYHRLHCRTRRSPLPKELTAAVLLTLQVKMHCLLVAGMLLALLPSCSWF
jgi:hypothetical protein